MIQQQPFRCVLILSGFIVSLSLIIILINHYIYHFPGNSFFPDNVWIQVVILLVTYIGINLLFKKNSRPTIIIQEIIYLFAVIAVIAFATDAVQLTPFPVIDQDIIALEKKMHIDLLHLLEWTDRHILFKKILNYIYDSLEYQMSILPLIVIFTGRTYLLREYYFLLLCTTLLGFGFYYFFPTTAPASILNSPLFTSEQIATGLKFNEIHHHILPSTNEGGLISLPSFHVIWAFLCVNLIREWPIPCIILTLINILLSFSCVSLGWHYYSDLVGSIVVLLMSYYFLRKYLKIKDKPKKRLLYCSENDTFQYP